MAPRRPTAASARQLVLRFALVLAAALLPIPVAAHNGPPFPMITDKAMGPCVVSLWTHPDVGTGTFFVVVDPGPGRSLPQDMRFTIGVAPKSGRLPEKLYGTTAQEDGGQVHYYAWVPFDKEELWHVNLYLRSASWNGVVAGDVMVTPTGFGQWDLLFFSAPFVGVGLLWFAAVRRKRRGRLTLTEARPGHKPSR